MEGLKFDHYFTSAEQGEVLHALQREHPDFMKVYSICRTPGGRDIWAVEITNPATGPIEEKPAFHVDGCTHCGEVTGSMATMYYINYVLENYGKLEDVTTLLDGYGVFAVPCITPDGMDTVLLTDQRPASTNRPYPKGELDTGLHAMDLDGDGMVRLMRIKSPYGAWKTSPDDPRFMVRRKPDDNGGTYYNIYPEGEYVGVYDGSHIKLARHKWDHNFNRNYPVAWEGDAVQRGAGDYPLCNPETKAMADFMLAHRNIAGIVTCHTSGGVFLYPPGPEDETKADRFDMGMFRALAKAGYREMEYTACGLHRFETKIGDNLYDPNQFSRGAFDDWMYIEQGVLATTIEFWNVRHHAGLGNNLYDETGRLIQTIDEAVDDWNKILVWLDENVGGDVVKPWTKFDHPQFGEVEIGGTDGRFNTSNCPVSMLENEIAMAARYFMSYALSLPKLQITEIEAKAEGEGIYRVSALVANTGYMPTYGSRQALKMQRADEITVDIAGEAGILNGWKCQKIGHLEGYSAIDTGVMGGARFWAMDHKPCIKKVSWLVYGKAGDQLTVTAKTPRAGTATAAVTL